MSTITLTTDYGSQDYYAGVLHGVILRIAPKARVVDITHDLEPYNIVHGAFVLRQIMAWYPEGTVHLVVVDPGVGSERRIVLGKYAGQYVVVPDNGLLTFVHREFSTEALHILEDSRFFLPAVSSTFHGRDIMAPVAAHLANGVAPREFGGSLDEPVLLPIEWEARSTGDSIEGVVLYVDRFGTLVTNIHRAQLSGLVAGGRQMEATVTVGDFCIGQVRSTFSDVAPGEPVALFGGADLLEIAVNRGRAADRFQPAHTRVTIR